MGTTSIIESLRPRDDQKGDDDGKKSISSNKWYEIHTLSSILFELLIDYLNVLNVLISGHHKHESIPTSANPLRQSATY